jgi:hypothetical protein
MKIFSFLASLSLVTLVLSSSIDTVNGDKLQLRKNYLEDHFCRLFDKVNIVSLNELSNALKLLMEIGKEESSFQTSQFQKNFKDDIISLLNLICDKIPLAEISGEQEISIVQRIKDYQFEVLVDLTPVSDVIELAKKVAWYFYRFEEHFEEAYKSKNEKLFSRIKFLELKGTIGSERAEKAMREKELYLNKEVDNDTLAQLGKNFRRNNLYTLFDNVDARCIAEFTNIVEHLYIISKGESIDRIGEIKYKILFNLKMVCEGLCDTGLSDELQLSIIESIKKFQFWVLDEYVPLFVPNMYVSALSDAVSNYLCQIEEFSLNNYLQNQTRTSKAKQVNGPAPFPTFNQNNRFDAFPRPLNVHPSKNSRHLINTEIGNVDREERNFRGNFRAPSQFPESNEQVYRAPKAATSIGGKNVSGGKFSQLPQPIEPVYRTLIGGKGASRGKFSAEKPLWDPFPIAKSVREKPVIDKNTVINHLGLDKDFPFNLRDRKYDSLKGLSRYLESQTINQVGDNLVITKIKSEIRDSLEKIINLLNSQAKDEALLSNTLAELKFQPLDKLLGLSTKIIDPHGSYDDNIFTLFGSLKALFVSVHSLIINKKMIYKGAGALDKAYNEFMQEYLTQNVAIFDKIFEEKEEKLLLELKIKSSEEKAQRSNSTSLEAIETEENQSLDDIYDAADDLNDQNVTAEDFDYPNDEIFDPNEELIYDGIEYENFDYEDCKDDIEGNLESQEDITTNIDNQTNN